MKKIGKNFKQTKILYYENQKPSGGLVDDFTKAWSDKSTLVIDIYGNKSEQILTHGYYDNTRSRNTFTLAVGGSIDQPKRIRTSFILHHSGSWDASQGDGVEVFRDGELMIKYYWEGYDEQGQPSQIGPMKEPNPATKTRGGVFNNCSYSIHFGGYSSSALSLGNWHSNSQGYLVITSDWLDVTSENIEYEFNMTVNQAVNNEAGFISHMKVEEQIPENYDIEIETDPNTQIVMAEDKQSYYYENLWDSASVYRNNWSDPNLHTITTSTLGTFAAHDFSATSGTLTVNNLPVHEEVRFSVYCHFVDTWDAGEGCIISCSDRDNVLQERARWLKNWSYPAGGEWEIEDYAEYVDRYDDVREAFFSPGDDKKQKGQEHWIDFGSRQGTRNVKLAHVEFVPDNYGTNQQSRTDTYNGYVKFVSAWMPHTHDSFQGKVHMTSNQSRVDEAGYVTHAHVEIRGGNRTIGLTRPVANDEFGNPFIATAEGRARTPELSPAGKIVFDCFWPKYYNHADHWQGKWRDEWLTDKVNYPDGIYSSNVHGSWPFLCNVIKYTSATRQTKTNKVLYFNDAYSVNNQFGMSMFWPRVRDVPRKVLGVDVETPDHPVTSTARNAHRLWVQAQNKTHEQWLDWFNQYDTVLWFGTNRADKFDQKNWLDQSTNNLRNFESAFVDYINGGGGMMCVTDSWHFTMTVNTLVKYFGVRLHNNIARTAKDGNLEPYKIKTFLKNTEYIPTGFHPLFADMHPEQYVVGGSSDGEIQFIHDDRITSVYTTDSNGKLTITQHTGTTYGGDNKTSTKLIETGNLLIRTPNDCGGS